MTPLKLFSYIGWTLASPDGTCTLKVEQKTEWCVDGNCARVEASAKSPDVWGLAPANVELRWTAADTAELECKGVRVQAKVTRESASALPAPPISASAFAKALGVDAGVAVPGTWSGGTRECMEGTQAWVFEPFDGSRTSVFVAREGEGWKVAPTKSGVVMCPGGKDGGVYLR